MDSPGDFDEKRKNLRIHKYLCRLDEARIWIEGIIKDELPEIIHFEEALRDGVIIAKLSSFFEPKTVPYNKIFDPGQKHFKDSLGLHFRHTDNINYFFKFMEAIGLPKVFYPETTDIYDRKNMPKLIFCIHAINLFLYRKGRATQIINIENISDFSPEIISAIKKQLELYNVELPNFSKIAGILANELPEDDAAMHAIIIAINEAILNHDSDSHILEMLTNPLSCLSSIVDKNISNYRQNVICAIESKRGKNNSIDNDDDVYLMYLTKDELQQKIDFINHATIMEEINSAVADGDLERLMTAFKFPLPQVRGVNAEYISFYMNKLKSVFMKNGGVILSLAEVKDAISDANCSASDILNLKNAVFKINEALESETEADQVCELLLHNFKNYNQDNKYFETLVDAKSKKLQNPAGNWVPIQSLNDPNLTIFYNIEQDNWTAEKPENYTESNNFLSSLEIQTILNDINSKRTKALFYKDNLHHIISIQCGIRHFIQKNIFRKDKAYLSSVAKSALVLQKIMRMKKVKKNYESYRDSLTISDAEAMLLQKVISGFLEKRKMKNFIKYFFDRIDQVIKIQAIFRGTTTKKNYLLLLSGETPPFSVIQEFIHLLDIKEGDFDDEMQLQFLRMETIRMIRLNQELQTKIEQTGQEAGLLIKNQIALMDDVQRRAKINKLKNSSKDAKNALTLTKDMEDLIDRYSKILYLFQTRPEYFCLMVENLKSSQWSSKIRDSILSCFNNGTHKREEYLLLKTFEYILEESVKNSFDNNFMSDNQVLELLVYVIKNIKSRHYDISGFVTNILSKVLENQVLQIKTDPNVIYKQWIYKYESEEGVSSKLPYNVTVEEAISHKPVQEALEVAFKRLIKISETVIEKIINGFDKIPYGIRFICVCLERLLTKYKIGDSEFISAAVCNFVYFRYINVAIVVPESFGAYVGSIDGMISNEQRFNLAEVGRLLQILVTGGSEKDASPNYSFPKLKDFLVKWRKPFRDFITRLCNVDDLNEHFQFDEYMDQKLLFPPQIYYSAFNLLQFHQLVLETAKLCDEDSLLNILLREVGDFNSETFLTTEYESEEERDNMLKEIEFVVTMKDHALNIENNEKQSIQKVTFLKCTLMVCQILRCQWSCSMEEMLNTPATDAEEKLNQIFAKKMERRISQIGAPNDRQMTLEDMKIYIKENTEKLIEDGFINKEEGYKAYIANISNEIREKRKLDLERKNEIKNLKAALQDLVDKNQFQNEQIESYNQYIISLMSQSMKKSKNKSKKPIKVRYSGKKMNERGILISVLGISEKDFNKLHVTIEEGDEPGTFSTFASFLGVSMKSTKFTLQKLLELQREGIGVINFEQAQCNVNLLIHLINRKFLTL